MCVEACPQGLAEVDVVSGAVLQVLIKVDECGYDQRDGQTITLEDLR